MAGSNRAELWEHVSDQSTFDIILFYCYQTTLLKILSSDHDSSGGVGLVAGYDVGTEPLRVFEVRSSFPVVRAHGNRETYRS